MGNHYVPQKYLRGFEAPDAPGWIWLHDKRDLVVRLVPIKTVAQSKQFYTPETEKRLANEVEKPGNEVIRKLSNGQAINPVDRVQLTYYIATMMKRVPYRRRRAMEMVPSVLDDVIKGIREQIDTLASEMKMSPDLVARRLQEIEDYKTKHAVEPPQTVLDQIKEPWPAEFIMAAIFNMTWRLLISRGPQYFMTCDNPVFYFECFGIGKPESELVFPLTTTHALHGCWQGPIAGLLCQDASQIFVKEINRRLASTTERLAFYHRKADWLMKILPKENPFLSRFNW